MAVFVIYARTRELPPKGLSYNSPKNQVEQKLVLTNLLQMPGLWPSSH